MFGAVATVEAGKGKGGGLRSAYPYYRQYAHFGCYGRSTAMAADMAGSIARPLPRAAIIGGTGTTGAYGILTEATRLHMVAVNNPGPYTFLGTSGHALGVMSSPHFADFQAKSPRAATSSRSPRRPSVRRRRTGSQFLSIFPRPGARPGAGGQFLLGLLLGAENSSTAVDEKVARKLWLVERGNG